MRKKGLFLLVIAICIFVPLYILWYNSLSEDLEDYIVSITIEKTYEIELRDTREFSYVFIPTGDLGDVSARQIKVYIDTQNSSTLIWTCNSIFNASSSNYKRSYDKTGTPWFNITLEEFDTDLYSEFKIRVITIRKEGNSTYTDEYVNTSIWLNPSPFIDSTNETIVSKSTELIDDFNLSCFEKAQRVINFLKKEMVYDDDFLPLTHETETLASEVLALHQGVCYDFARLFTALCRASGVPSRVVFGYYIGEDQVPIGHAWAEMLDTDKNWYTVEPRVGFLPYKPPTHFNYVHGPFHDESFFIYRSRSQGYLLGEGDDDNVFIERNPVCVNYQIKSKINHSLTIFFIIFVERISEPIVGYLFKFDKKFSFL